MRRAAWGLCLLLLAGAGPGGAAPDERAQAYARATARLGRALVLVAARNGVEAARKLAGGHLPARVGAGLERVAGSSAAADLRATGAGQLELQGMLVPRVIADVADLDSSLAELAALGGARLSQELSQLEAECRRLQGAATALERGAKAGSVPSRLAAQGQDAGPALLLLARGAPLLLDDLGHVRGQLPRYELLARILGRAPDPWARFLLDLAPRAAESARDELRAAGDRASEVAALARQAEQRLGGACEVLQEAILHAVAAATRIRQEELNRSLAGGRGPELAHALTLLQGYKSQFGEPPDLEALPTWDVYADRRNGRLHFWLEGERRWERGPERVDPLQPLEEALLQARDPGLRTLVVEARALFRLLVAFEGPFAQGMADLTAAAEAVVGGVARIEGLGREHGLPAEALAAALEARVGASLRLLGPSEGRLVALRERALAAAIQRGPAASRDLLGVLQAAARDLATLRVQAAAVGIEGAGGALGEGTEVDLVWSPDPALHPEAWLLPPPARVRGGRIAVLLVAGSQRAAVRGFALEGGKVLSGEVPLTPDGGSALRLVPAAGPALIARSDGAQGLRVVQLPRAGEPLWVWRAGPGERRPLRPVQEPGDATAGSGWAWAVDLAVGEDGGTWTLVGEDAAGAERARLELAVPARPRVVLRSPAGAAALGPGGSCEAEVVGAPAAEREWVIESEAGVPLARARGATLTWTADLPRGRYRVVTPGAAPAALPVSASTPRVEVVLAPWAADDVAAVHTGQGVCLRLAAWPTVAPHELLRVEWTVSGGGGAGEARAVTRPVPGAPWVASLLPLRIAAGARPGERQVRARLHTLRGTLEARGSFRVVAGGAELPLELRDAQGERTNALALGSEGLLRAPRELRGPAWVLVGPQGTVRTLAPRWDGQVPLSLAEHDPPGEHQVWLSASTPSGEPVHGRLVVLAYARRELEVRTPPVPPAGGRLRLEALPPGGFQAPFQVRLGRGAWTPGTALEVVTQVENAFEVELRDARDRRAAGRVTFRAGSTAGVESPLRFGIAADAREKRVFAVDHALLQSYKRSNNLPPTWAVLEPGPLSAAAVRDRMFQTVPFDGPSDPADVQLAYRSVRFWDGLQESARARFAALGATPGEPYAVQNSPSPGGETTLRDLAARLLSERGGWEYRLSAVELEAEGASPDPTPPRKPGELVRFKPWSAQGRGGDLGRVIVAGPFGRMALRPTLPPTLTLGREGRIGLTLAVEREPLLAGRAYPAGWEQLAPGVTLLLELEVRVTLDGEELTTVVRRVDPEQVGIDLGVVLVPLGTERAGPAADAPRVAEKVALRLLPLHLAPEERERRLPPAPPGVLDPEPRLLVLELAARLVPAVLPRDWPAGRPRPDALFVDAVPYLPDAGDLPRCRARLTVTWTRGSKDAPPVEAGPGLGERLAAPDAGASEEPDAVLTRLEAAWPVAEAERGATARALRQVLLRAPQEPRAWALLADLALAEGRTLEAQNQARWARSCGASPLAQVVELEALLANFRLEEARRALQALGRGPLAPGLQRRVEAARRTLGAR